MGDTSRKVENPLLNAAGVSFPFEDFASSAMLMPVTPASSSVLKDEGEIDSFVGQRQPDLTAEASFSELHIGPSPSQYDQQNPQHQSQPRLATSEVYISSTQPEPQNLGTTSQSNQRQGYLSSFLSSLPNLSLSSITGEREAASQSINDQPPSSTGYYYPETTNSWYTSNSPLPPPPADPSQVSSTFSPVQTFAPVPPPATVQPPPVALPPTGNSSSTYRLGNQRRLKYAPPPDLATSAPRPVDVPLQPPIFSAQAPTTFYPQPLGIPHQSAAPGPLADPNYRIPGVLPFTPRPDSSKTSSPGSEVARSNPLGIPNSSSSGSIRQSCFEPATPQNTPANFTLTNYPRRDWSPPVRSVPNQVPVPDVLRTLPTIPSEHTTGPPISESEPVFNPDVSQCDEQVSPSPFAPISAARVSEKLEHLLAQESGDLEPESRNSTEVVDSGLSSASKSEEAVASAIDTASGTFEPIALHSGDERPLIAPEPVFVEANTTSNYFAAATSQSGSALFDLSKFHAPASQSIGHFPGFQTPNSAPVVSQIHDTPHVTQTQQSTVPLYDPTQFQTTTKQPDNIQPLFNNSTSYLYTSNNVADNNVRIDESPTFLTPPSPPMAFTVPEPTGSATLDPIQVSINPLATTGHANPLDLGTSNIPPSLHNLAAGGVGGTRSKQMTYRPVYQHWFHRKEVENKVLWVPFSMQDSLNLEEVHNSSDITPETVVPTDGGRYDVDILRRQRSPVYWSGEPNEVRRCSWFCKGPAESRYVPYEESVAARLEEEYQKACTTDSWNRRIDMNNGEYVIFHSPTVQVHYLHPGSPELASSWGNNVSSEDSTYLQSAASRPRVVKRGVDEFNIDDGEPDQADHLLFLVHGIGSVCDLKFRSVEEVVDEFRSISLQLVQSHYRTASERGIVNKIEVLPISWHTTLHSDDTGIDKKLEAITLESIPKLRHFTNDTLLDILFYTSPIYCQTIMQTVGNEMNRLYALFKERNPSFQGGVYLGGHSLGSLIVFDLLCHQKPPKEEEAENEEEISATTMKTANGGVHETADEQSDASNDDVGPIPKLKGPILKRRLSRKISYVMGAAGTGQPYINYPELSFNPNAFFALGSPIGMFVTVRGIDNLGENFRLPTCPAFFNIFHPFDPVAYRIESLIVPGAHKFRPMLIPHHKGRKRMHLELKETMARVGADLKQKVLDSVRNTWNSVYQLAMFHKQDNQTLQREIDKVVEEQLQTASSETETMQHSQNDESGADIKIGSLNGGRRIDYVLQEAPFEYINEYIFALTSHVCYWESEDTMLLMLKEIYGAMGIQTDAQLPQQTLTIERVSPSPSVIQGNTSNSHFQTPGSSTTMLYSDSPPIRMGMDPTAPVTDKPVGPPPISGFVRKS